MFDFEKLMKMGFQARNMKRIEFNEDGGISAIEFHDSDDSTFIRRMSDEDFKALQEQITKTSLRK